MKPFIKVLLVFVFFNCFAQPKKIVYVNEAYAPIDFHEFSRKVKFELFHVAVITSDTAVYKKLRYKEYFGKIDPEKKVS